MDPIQALAMNIVNQLFDEAEVSVEKRQAINDKCDKFVQDLVSRFVIDCFERAIERTFGSGNPNN